MTSIDTDRTLSIADACSIADIVRMAQNTAKIAYLRTGPGHEGEEPLYGHARSITDARGGFLPLDIDVRDGFLRVTTRSGFEVSLPLAALIEAHKHHYFVATDWS